MKSLSGTFDGLVGPRLECDHLGIDAEGGA